MGRWKLAMGWAIVLFFASAVPAQVGLEPYPNLDPNRDWPWWRGVSRDGHALGSAPVNLNPSKNADWNQPIPGRGHGSPVVVGDQVVMITADEQRQVHSMIAQDRNSGKQLWQYVISEGGFPDENHPKNTEASPTVASDGERFICAIFHHKAIWVTSVTADGKKEWEQRVASYNPTRYRYGYAASPLIYGDLVIVAYEYDGPSGLVALSRKTGKEVWRTDRPGTITFSSPTVTSVDGQDYLLITGNQNFRAYDPKTGKEIWSTPGVATATCGTVVWEDGIAFASGGYPQSETLAVDIKTGKPLWRNKLKSYEQSMVASNGHLYAYVDSGFVVCWDAKTGDEKWRHRLTDKISASGVLVGKNIYWANEAGDLWVFEDNPKEYVEVARNKVGDEAFASPAICGGQVFLRVAKRESGKRQEYLLRFSRD
jgi:outer membrane protein assembly factor BamB